MAIREHLAVYRDERTDGDADPRGAGQGRQTHRPRGIDRVAYLQVLNEFVLAEVNAGNNVVLIIDEAQDLSDELLEQVRLLSNLETDHQKLMQIILMGQPELRDKLAQPKLRQLRQRITVRYHLQPLTLEETAAYVRHRLTTAGMNGRPSVVV
mgnify:CR=1 FL=1